MLKSTNGINLYTQNFLVANAKASLLLIHGLGEYSGRYTHVIKALNENAINVYTFDLRGHGLSEGERAFITEIDEYREDVEKVYRTIPKDLPFFVLGHSMGGLIATHFLLFNERADVKGVVLTGAALEVGADISSFKQKAIRLLNKLSPKLKTVKLDPNSISRKVETVKAYIADPLIYHDGGKAGLAVALLNAIAAIKPQFKNFNYPALIMHGEADKITNPAGSKRLFDACSSDDKTLKIWDEAYHEIYNEINQDEVIKTTTEWLIARI